MSLFRQEAVGHQQQKFYGTILLSRPWSYSALAAFFFGVAILIVAFFFMFGFARKVAVPGVLLPEAGLVRVYAPQSGLLVARQVKDGQEVHAGEVLFVLSGERTSSVKGDTQLAIGDAISSRIDKLRNELTELHSQHRNQQAALERRHAALLAQIDQIDNEINLQLKRAQLVDASAQRFAELGKSNYVSDAQVQDKVVEALDQQARLRTLERNRTSIKMDLASVEADLVDQPFKARRESSASERSISELEQSVVQNEAQREIVVRAPKGGRVTAIVGELGQLIVSNQPLASIIPPDGKLEAELFAPSRAAGFVRPGTRVQLRYQAYPYQKFGQYAGTVTEVSNAAMQPGEISLPLARDPNSTEPFYRIRVRIDRHTVQAYGRPEALKSGMQIDASLVLEYRKLYEWVIEPLYGLKGRI